MDGITGVGSSVDTATAGVNSAVNLNVLKDTQNLTEDLVARLFSTLGVGTNVSTHG